MKKATLAPALLVVAIGSISGCGNSSSKALDGGKDFVMPRDAGIEGLAPDGGDVTVDGPIADAATSDAGIGRLAVEELVYTGAFRLSSADHGASSANYAVGTLAYNGDHHSLFIAGHAHHNAIAEFAIPTPSMSMDKGMLPEVSSPLQGFAEVLDRSPNGNPEGINRITGLLYVGGQLLVNAETWYDAAGANVDTTLVFRDANDLAGSAVDGYFELQGATHAGGYMSPIPAAWQSALGGPYVTGWSSVYSIISRYSVGPSLFVFDPQDITGAAAGSQGPITTRAWMDFPHGGGHYLGDQALDTQEGSAPALWNFLSRGVYGLVIPGTKTFAVFGSTGGVDSGIGYKITQDDGSLCGGYCAYQHDDYTNYYWFFDLEEITGANEVYDPRPYAFGQFAVPFDENGGHAIIGGTFDPQNNTLYFALEGAGQMGAYDYVPLVVTYKLPSP